MENHNTCMVGHELDRCDRAHNPGDVVTVYVLTRHHGEKYPGAASDLGAHQRTSMAQHTTRC